MKKAWLIALNTFRESIRKKTLYIILIFALIVIGASKLFSFLTAEEELKMIKDVSFSAIEFFGALMAIFGSLSAISNEIERRTIYTLLTKPIRRSDFVLGKFFGVSLILLINFFPVYTRHVLCPEVVSLQSPGITIHLLPFYGWFY